MTIVYLDASIVAPLFVSESASAAVTAWFAGLEGEPYLTALASAEFCSSIARRVRMALWREDDAGAALLAFDVWRDSIGEHPMVSEDVRAAEALVRRFDLKLGAPDAIHLAACKRSGALLATLDARLAAAASALSVPLAPFP